MKPLFGMGDVENKGECWENAVELHLNLSI